VPIKSFPSSEYELLHSLKPYLNFRKSHRYPIGIGDDAAIRACSEKETLIFTADSFVEDVHFSFSYMTSADIGYKAMAINLSDCAAMGAIPDGALVQIIFPVKIDLKKFDETIKGIYRGFNELCRKWDFPIIGGNLAKGPCWIIDITLIGRSRKKNRLLKRTGAKNNDGLWVTGFPGTSGAGLACLKRWGSLGKSSSKYAMLARKHCHPVPRIEIGRELCKNHTVHSMIDISDGISNECHTLAYETGLGILLTVDVGCVSSEMIRLGAFLQKNWSDWFFNGGEDYELLFAASSAFDPVKLATTYKIPITRIGTFSRSLKGVFLNDPARSIKPLGKGGWDHLRRNALPKKILPF
jgi:thiamine-monophosphate kinase